VFRPHELRELDAHLEVIAEEELRRLDAGIARYVAGEAGHVVAISYSRHGIARVLSDGRRIALGGVRPLQAKAARKPRGAGEVAPCPGGTRWPLYRLLLRSEAGAEIEVYTRRVALAP
jgi:hypothetical protein